MLRAVNTAVLPSSASKGEHETGKSALDIATDMGIGQLIDAVQKGKNLADSCVVEWKRDYRVDTLQVHRGWLKFSRSKLIGVDGERNSVFLSGDFDMDYEPLDSFGVPSHSSDSLHFMNDYVSGDGWFDVVITRSNFDKK